MRQHMEEEMAAKVSYVADIPDVLQIIKRQRPQTYFFK